MTLQEIYIGNPEAIKELKDLADSFLNELAIKRIFTEKKDIAGLFEAKEVFKNLFDELDSRLGSKPRSEKVIDNPAR